MKNCKECGTEISIEGQKFCEKCGAELIQEQKKISLTAPTTRATPPSPTREGGLFDLSRNYYLIKENAWDLGYGEIYDEKGQTIGLMHRILFSIRRRVELQEPDGSVVATIHSKIISARGAQDLKDPLGVPIARIKRKILTFFKQKFFLEEPETKIRWYEAEGDFFGW
ncbi:MAG: zinc-ribbon domain-containing protein, partial [Candidatus Lokiarchaeota archaeon]|nr:zinc-ribbon domain-containing protein [Candidatus Lokiarchaeota archaeon]